MSILSRWPDNLGAAKTFGSCFWELKLGQVTAEGRAHLAFWSWHLSSNQAFNLSALRGNTCCSEQGVPRRSREK